MTKQKNRSRLEKEPAKQFAGVGTGFDMDSSAFFFGDLNTWGAYPTLPTISQRPRVQVFYMVRNWSERNCFIKTIKTLRHAIYNYGFKVTGEDAKSKAQVDKWMKGNWYGIPLKKIVRQFVKDTWEEWLIQDNVISTWRKEAMGYRPVVMPIEKCSYTDEYGVERLGFSHGITKDSMDMILRGRSQKEKVDVVQNETVWMGKRGYTSDDPVFDFEVIKRTAIGCGLAWPQLRTLFNTMAAWEGMELADWQLSDCLRTVYELHKVGHEIKQGPFAGKPAHFLKKIRADAIRSQIKMDKNTLASVKKLIVNFDHDISYPRPDPKNFAASRFEGHLNRLMYWGMPLTQMLLNNSVNPIWMPLLQAQAEAERDYINPFIAEVLVKSLHAPEGLMITNSNAVFMDTRTLSDTLKTGLQAGPLSQSTFLKKHGLDPDEERANKDEEHELPKHQTHPIFDAAHGEPKPGGRAPGKGDSNPRKSKSK